MPPISILSTSSFSSPLLKTAFTRAINSLAEKDEVDRIEIGGILKIDLQKYQVSVDGNAVDVTSTEFKILKMLAEKKDWVFSRQQILDYLWGTDKCVVDRTVDVHIKNLKKKLGSTRKFIKNVRGIGYKLED